MPAKPKGKHDFTDRQFDLKVYDKDYFEGEGLKSGYKSYEQAKVIVQDQFEIINKVMRDRVADGAEATVHIDVGCAYGHGVAKMKELGWVSVGGDVSEFAIKRGKEIYGEDHEISVSDARGDSFWKGFDKLQACDLVTSVEFFEHIPSEDVDGIIKHMAQSARWGLFVINARTAPGQDPMGSHGDHGHLNNHSMTWWIDKFSQYGEVDYEAMFDFNKRAEAYNADVHWHNRCLVVKFNETIEEAENEQD